MLPSLTKALEVAPPEVEALRAIVRRHAKPASEWPERGHAVRELADRAARCGAPDKAALVLIAVLEDLGRYFAIEDEDDDGGWHRSEEKRWEAWAYARALRSVLVDSDSRHPKFGIGRVVRAEGTGDQRKYVVAFDAFGEKTLLARFVEPA